MKKATILATAISLLTINLYAQTEGYKFGGYIGIGRSSFSIMGEEAYKAMYINNNSAFILTEANAGTSNSVNLSIVKQIKNFIALHADASLSNSTYSYTLKEYDKSKNINNNYSDNFSLTQFTIPVYFKPSLGIAKTVFLKSYFGLAPSINKAICFE